MRVLFVCALSSVADQDPACHFEADEDPDPYPACHFDPDPDSTIHADAIPDTDPSFKIKARNLKKCSNRLILHIIWLVICKLMRIRIQLITLMRIRILPSNLKWIRIHNTGDKTRY